MISWDWFGDTRKPRRLQTRFGERCRRNFTLFSRRSIPFQYRVEIHPVESNTDQLDLFVVELTVPRTDSGDLYFTGGNETFVRVDGVKRKLTGPQLVDWIRRRMPS